MTDPADLGGPVVSSENVDTRTAIGIDVGGTKIAGSIVSATGALMEQRTVATPRGPAGADPGAAATLALVDQLCLLARSRLLSPVAIGIGVPEYVTPSRQINSSEVLDWPEGVLHGAGLTMPLIIESDVRCGALAEHHFGFGQDDPQPGGHRLGGRRWAGRNRPGSFLYASIGTGVSYTMVIDGEIWAGHRGEAIALGELPVRAELTVRPEAPPTVEQQASGRAIELANSGEGAPSGRTQRSTLRSAGTVMGEALGMVAQLLDPEVIVLGGGLGTSSGEYADALEKRYGELMSRRPNPPPVLRSTLGTEGGLLGAALMALA